MMKILSLCNRLKSHLLIHLSQEIERFAGGPHMETERCERQHKFMGDLLCHTSRQNGGRDVAVRFAEEYMLRHISLGGLFVKDTSSPVWESCSMSATQSFDPTIFERELELLENNNSQRKLVVGLAGVFRNSTSSETSGLTLGKLVSQAKDKGFQVEAYNFVANAAIPEDPQTCIYERGLVDAAENVVVKRSSDDNFTIGDHDQNAIEIMRRSAPVFKH
ncbi:uncharacterized protein EV154DRAFT_526606 [Mucor mucedo]|uniref:uncharacterized protein n=1 Tax=Mucor mucedo TaxID=29922 RepID=UPI00221EE4E7|nr:uncharacterized protein EV154DRAFT_526606 [Mucor mucedo]KAI7875545.1 hypothetical protein EV154DRAFT_526606 [Mucor mucedo]